MTAFALPNTLGSHECRPSTVESAGAIPAGAKAAARPPRVLHFHSSQGLYGPERWTYLLLRNAPTHCFESEVLTIGSKPGYDDFSRFLRSRGFAAHHLAIRGRIGLEAIRNVRRLVVERRIDILHTHGFKSDIVGYLASRGLRIGLVTTPHGWCDHESFRIRIYEMIGRGFMHAFDRVYPLSDHQTEFLRRRRGLRGSVRRIRNAVDIAAFTGVFERRMARTSAGGGPLLFVGRLGHEKGILDLIRAFKMVSESRADARLLVIGSGPDKERVADLIAQLTLSPKVELLGFQEDVCPYLEQSSALVLPSYSEGIPRVVMEAFAAGVPVIGTDIPGIRELVRDGCTGLLSPVGDPPRLAAVLNTVLADPERARGFAAAGRKLVEDDYSPRRMAEEFCEEYARLAATRPTDTRVLR